MNQPEACAPVAPIIETKSVSAPIICRHCYAIVAESGGNHCKRCIKLGFAEKPATVKPLTTRRFFMVCAAVFGVLVIVSHALGVI